MTTRPHRAARLLFVASLALAGHGCGSDPAPSGQLEPNQQAEPTEPAASDEPGDAVPVIASDQAEFDFGTIKPTESVTHVFKIVNRGTADLKIERVERT